MNGGFQELSSRILTDKTVIVDVELRLAGAHLALALALVLLALGFMCSLQLTWI